jgi:hypothetical protein
MVIASVHVNFRPLNGNWDGQNWDEQEARCSNNFLSGPTPPVPSGGASSILWQVVGLSDPDSVVFNVSVDRPGDDEVVFTGLKNGVTTSYLPTPETNGMGQYDKKPYHGGHPVAEYYNRGIYIAKVAGASEPFTLKLVTGATV